MVIGRKKKSNTSIVEVSNVFVLTTTINLSIENGMEQCVYYFLARKKGNQYHFGIKAHVGVDADSGIVHSVAVTGANVADIAMADDLICENDDTVFVDAGYQGLEKHDRTKDKTVLVAMRPGKRKTLAKDSILSRLEYIKSQIRANAEYPFCWFKCEFEPNDCTIQNYI